MHDFFLFHNFNCALPANFYWVFLIWTGILSCACLVATLTVAYRRRGEWRTIALMHCVQIACSWSCVLCIYLQNGFFEAAAIIAGVSLILATFQLYHLFKETLLKPLFKVEIKLSEGEKRRIHLAFASVPLLSAARLMVIHIALAVLCRRSDPTQFNLVFVVNAFLAPVFAGINAWLIRPHRNRMIELIDQSLEGMAIHQGSSSSASSSSSPSSSMAAVLMDYRQRLQRIVKHFNSTLMFYMYFFVPYGIVFLIVGSAPFLWVFQAISLHVTYIWTIHLVRNSRRMDAKTNKIVMSTTTTGQQQPLVQDNKNSGAKPRIVAGSADNDDVES